MSTREDGHAPSSLALFGTDPASDAITLACQAMATRFEFVIHSGNPATARAAGEEAIEEIERLEAQLSLYRPSSEIAHLNARAGREWFRVSPILFSLLEHAQKLWTETDGAFDITVAPLVRCWGFMGGVRRVPTPEELAEARSKVGMNLVKLQRADFAVRFDQEGVMLDLGAIGKGYAIDRAAEVLREAGIQSALVHGGTSSAYAIGNPPGAEAWTIGIQSPPGLIDTIPPIRLKDEAISVSSLSEKFFEADGQTYGHVLDPRTGRPTTAALLSAVISPSATETDAFSTALLTLGITGQNRIAALRPGIKTLLATPAGLSTTGAH